MDADDYLLNGVMNGNQAGIALPPELGNDMLIGMLDTCDQIIDDYRKKDRSFDVGCDDNFILWDRVHLDFARLRVGMTIYYHHKAEKYGEDRTYFGTITAFSNENYGPREVDNATPASVPRWVRIDLREPGRTYEYGAGTMASISDADWNADAGRVSVPIPVDGATLGRYPYSYPDAD